MSMFLLDVVLLGDGQKRVAVGVLEDDEEVGYALGARDARHMENISMF